MRSSEELTQPNFVDDVAELLEMIPQHRAELTKVDPDRRDDAQHHIRVSVVERIFGHGQMTTASYIVANRIAARCDKPGPVNYG
jgi:hypothetical protein